MKSKDSRQSRGGGVLRACLFDMGNVLVHFSHERMCRQIASVCEASPDDVQRLLFNGELHWKFDRGELTSADFHRLLCEEFEGNPTLDELKLAASDIFELNSPIVAVLHRLKQAGIRLILLSNTSSAHHEFIRDRFDVLNCFDGFSMSFEVGAIKPEDAIYLKAVELAGVEPGECFYTDDIESYVMRGRELGIDSEVFVGVEPLIEQLRARRVDI